MSYINMLSSINTLTCHFPGLKKKSSLAVELSLALEKLDERVDTRAEERELKRMQLEADLLEKQREKEREHEMHMQGMMLSFMQQMMSTITGRGYNSPSGMTSHLPHASHPTPYADHPHTLLSNEEFIYPPVAEHPNTSSC